MLTLLLAALAVAEVPPESPGRLSARTLDAHLDQLIPLVEEVTGRSFTTRPEVLLSKPGATRQVLISELETVCKRLYPGIADPMAHSLAFWIAQDDMPYLFGKYGIETQLIYLRPQTIITRLLANDVRRRHHQGSLRLVLVHELAHALQAQTAGLEETYARVPNWEAFRALAAATEGHAVAVEGAVAARLGLTETSKALSELLGATYHVGHDFVVAHAEEPAQAWSVIEQPPEHTGQILHPETWRDGRARYSVSHQPWFGATEGLGFGELGGMNQDVGEWELHSQLLPVSWKARSELGLGVLGGREWKGVEQKSGATIELWMWVFERDEQAAAVVDTVNRNKERIAARNPWHDEQHFTVVPNLVRKTGVVGLDAHHTRYDVDFQQTYGDSFRKTSIWAADGPVLIQLRLWTVGATDDRFAAAVNAALAGSAE